ncbi:IS66-like element accessory protein TnpA [Vineibacter terrae]|uniref:IS66-like element accessory protein TnpA n=1 Tax=Vineibacter terrae TaxID=2586908 RepID=UPI002E36303B|nr:transposase [Vineibacter terrae]HEX2892005.1 transposase [Vineibacter terrae]
MTAVTVLSGRERRRRWTAEQKAQIVEESFTSGAIVAEVARRHDVNANQLHHWRQQGRDVRLGVEPSPAFVPVEISAASPAVSTNLAGSAPSVPQTSSRASRQRLPVTIKRL